MGTREPQRNHVFRTRFLLRMTGPARLHIHHGPAIYALLANAYGRATGTQSVAAEGILLDTPEQCRIRLQKGDHYAFGCTILAADPASATGRLRTLASGLRQLGVDQSGRAVFRGNFELVELRDLIANAPLADDQKLEPVSEALIRSECERLAGCAEVTLRFVAPFRSTLPRCARRDGHAYFDAVCFPAADFLKRVASRAARNGLDCELRDPGAAVAVSENRLVWMDLAYGPRTRRKSLGGAAGRLRLRIDDPSVLPLLVWGQYVQVGEGTNFGLGAYRIEQLGPHPFPCNRSMSLFDVFVPQSAGRKPPNDEFSGAANAIRQGDYEPQPYNRIHLERDDGDFRQLAIPTARDRALQRRIAKGLAPVLDLIFEESSFAYRKGLGRARAARRLRSAFRDGYRHAVRADFFRFFDSIDHQLLRDRLEVYLRDDTLAELIMLWVTHGAPRDGRGVPTGAPLSPLLSNLFLDAFDEAIESSGGVLVRYADDFVILFRTAEQAGEIFAAAERAAETLKLRLNEDKSVTLDLAEPFDFLGFRFHKTHRWQADAQSRPQRLDDLGWQQAPAKKAATEIRLPGETDAISDAAADPVAIFGPQRATLTAKADQLICKYADDRPTTTIPIRNVRQILVLGPVTIAASATRAALRVDIPILVADRSARHVGMLTDTAGEPSADAICALLAAGADPYRRLAIARELVAAKVWNFAILTAALVGDGDVRAASGLHDFAAQVAEADTVEEVLGYEGAAAAAWYALLPDWLPDGYAFTNRVAPDAEDPVNVVLNVAHSALYREATLALRLIGLPPSPGILHVPRSGHLALASDLMEPFRHLMERVAIEFLRNQPRSIFRTARPGSRYQLEIAPKAARQLAAAIHMALAQPVVARGRVESRSYRLELISQARRLRRHLLDPAVAFEAFAHRHEGQSK